MSIWTYNAQTDSLDYIKHATQMEECLFCKTKLVKLPHASWYTYEDLSEDKSSWHEYHEDARTVRCCPVCGWWTLKEYSSHSDYQYDYSSERGAVASLVEFDLTDPSLPIEDIRNYLAAKYETRFQIDPWKMEEIVASVYSDFGYKPRVTGQSHDGGIDIILDGPNNTIVGVQVKRYRKKIGVEQIRSFAGTLLFAGITKGIFVTTSNFSRFASKAAELSTFRGKPIELVDALTFYDKLGLAQREIYDNDKDPTAPFQDCKLLTLERDTTAFLR